MDIKTMNICSVEELVLAFAIVIATDGCAERHLQVSSDAMQDKEPDAGRQPSQKEPDAGRQPSEAEREAWDFWTSSFVKIACDKGVACGGFANPCFESGWAATDMARCDTAVNFYIANREELEECISKFPTDCSVTPAEACPLITGDKEFETICK